MVKFLLPLYPRNVEFPPLLLEEEGGEGGVNHQRMERKVIVGMITREKGRYLLLLEVHQEHLPKLLPPSFPLHNKVQTLSTSSLLNKEI